MDALNQRPIGVFDSGVGGLTVLKALRDALPKEDFVYLGDTARLPYGTKSAETVIQYALQAADLLLDQNIKLLIVACNTASAVAMPKLFEILSPLPCLGVIEPSAKAAAAHSMKGHIAVLATEGTVRSGAYQEAIRKYNQSAKVDMLACNLLVSMAEEGWCEGDEAETIIGRYLRSLQPGFDTLLLGCTHFPLLVPTLIKLLGNKIKIIDSAQTVAETIKVYLELNSLLSPETQPGKSRFLVTDSPERFTMLAKQFLGTDIARDVTFAHLSPISEGLVPSLSKAVKAS